MRRTKSEAALTSHIADTAKPSVSNGELLLQLVIPHTPAAMLLRHRTTIKTNSWVLEECTKRANAISRQPNSFNPYSSSACLFYDRARALHRAVNLLNIAKKARAISPEKMEDLLLPFYEAFSNSDVSAVAILKLHFDLTRITYPPNSSIPHPVAVCLEPYYQSEHGGTGLLSNVTLAEFILCIAAGLGIHRLHPGINFTVATRQAKEAWDYLISNGILNFALIPDGCLPLRSLWTRIVENNLFDFMHDVISIDNFFTDARNDPTPLLPQGYPGVTTHTVITAIHVSSHTDFVSLRGMDELPLTALINYVLGLSEWQKLSGLRPLTLLIIAKKGMSLITPELTSAQMRELIQGIPALVDQVSRCIYQSRPEQIGHIPIIVTQHFDPVVVSAIANALIARGLMHTPVVSMRLT